MPPALTTDNRVLTTARDAELAVDVLAELRGPQGQLAVHRDGNATRLLPHELGAILQQVLDVVSRGGTVTVGAVPNELTTVTAAEVIGVSRPTVMKLIRDGELPAHKVGSHHRLYAEDVFAYLRARRAIQRAAFDRLRELDDRVE